MSHYQAGWSQRIVIIGGNKPSKNLLCDCNILPLYTLSECFSYSKLKETFEKPLNNISSTIHIQNISYLIGIITPITDRYLSKSILSYAHSYRASIVSHIMSLIVMSYWMFRNLTIGQICWWHNSSLIRLYSLQQWHYWSWWLIHVIMIPDTFHIVSYAQCPCQ